MVRRIVTAWLALNVVILALYTWIPPLFFNQGTESIGGMPEIVYWFTVLPFVIPAVLGLLYRYDTRLMRQRAERKKQAR